MKENYPWIIILYVPAACTGLFQPCDVGVQRVFKHAVRRSSHAHIVAETVEQLNNDIMPAKVTINKKVGILRNRSVEWLVNAYHAIDDAALIRQVCTQFIYFSSYTLKLLYLTVFRALCCSEHSIQSLSCKLNKP